MDKTYYWRIDTNGVSETWKGGVWSFTVDDGSAKNPNPANYAYDVNTATALTWIPGLHAASHKVYFGTDESPAYVGPKALGDESYDPSLDYGKTYYWKIEEVNDTYVGSSPGPWEGPVWSFDTNAFKVIDDFEGDANSLDLRARWDDYYADNSNGGAVTLIADESQARNGTKAMTFDWMSTGYAYMAATLNTSAQDWTVGNLKSLSVYFYGDTGNGASGLTGLNLNVVVSDGTFTSTQTYGDINDINVPEWHEWNIPLTSISADSVSLGAVTSFALTITNTSTTAGFIRVDDIRLYPTRCVVAESSLSGDITGDCIVNDADYEEVRKAWLLSAAAITDPCVGHWKFDDGSGTNVTDSSSNGNDGTIYGGEQWVTGYKGSGALRFDGTDDYVEIADDSNDLTFGDRSFTIAFWSKSEGGGNRNWLNMMSGGRGWNIRDSGNWFRLEADTGVPAPYTDPDRLLIYANQFNIPDWQHLAFVRDVDVQLNAYAVYVNGYFFISNTSQYPEGEENIDTPLGTPLTIGSSADGYMGIMDDLIIYNDKALTEAQIRGLMGISEVTIPADIFSSVEMTVNFKDYCVISNEWMLKDFYP